MTSYDPSDAINLFVAQTDIAAKEIATVLGLDVTSRDVRRALVVVCGVADEPDLFPLNLSIREIVSRLAGFDFASQIPITQIWLDESILPPGIPGRTDEAEAKHKNEIWRVHKNDADPFPSNPHAHNVETGYKLHLGNGSLYHKTKQIGAIQWKHLLAIREKLTNVTLPPLEPRHG